MTNKDLELLEKYEGRIRRGFPVGEVKTELLNSGFTEKEANDFMNELSKLSSKKSVGRKVDFQILTSLLLLLFGVYLLTIQNSKIGIWFIISGIIKIVYDLFINKKKTL